MTNEEYFFKTEFRSASSRKQWMTTHILMEIIARVAPASLNGKQALPIAEAAADLICKKMMEELER